MIVNRREIIAGAGAALMLPVLGSGVSAQAALNLSSVLPDANFQVRNAKRYAEEVSKATNNAVMINVRAGGSLGYKGPEQMRAVRDGLVPMADILTSQQIGDEAIFGTDGIPFCCDPCDVLQMRLESGPKEGPDHEAIEVYGRADHRRSA